MPTLGANNPTLLDFAKRLDPDGRIAAIVELLQQTNEVLQDMSWKEGNLPTGHRTTVRTGLPATFWRLINQGVPPSKARTAQMDEGIGMLESYSAVDKDLALLNGNTAEFRLSEALAHLESMSQEAAQTVFYGNTTGAPEEFNGLATRYSSLSAENAQNIIDAGGTGSDNSSIYLVGWGDNTIHGIFPKGSKAGLIHDDLGEQTVVDSTGIAGSVFQAFRDHYQWKMGIALKDWRYVVRICNIDISNLVAKTTAADLFDKMIMAINRIPMFGSARFSFYMNRTVREMLEIQGRDDVQAGGGLTYDTVAGRRIPMFREIPVKLCDALVETEARVV